MKKIKPIVQRPQDLILACVSDDCLPETQILAQNIWQYQDWQIRFAIIGESHRVRLSYQGKFIMEEMLACADIPLQTCQHHHQLADLQPHQYQHANYSVNIDINDNPTLWQEKDEATLVGHHSTSKIMRSQKPVSKRESHLIKKEIKFIFPPINGKEALTRLQWQATKTAIHWRSLHTYICDGKLLCVYSQSQYDFQAEE